MCQQQVIVLCGVMWCGVAEKGSQPEVNDLAPTGALSMCVRCTMSVWSRIGRCSLAGRLLSHTCVSSGCSGASTMYVAPNSVSGRVVNTDRRGATSPPESFEPEGGWISNSISAPWRVDGQAVER